MEDLEAKNSIDVRAFVQKQLDSSLGTDFCEEACARGVNTMDSLCRLIEVLCAQGLISWRDIKYVSTGYEDKK